MSYVCFHVLSHPLPFETCLMMQETHCRCQTKRHPLAKELKLYSDDRAPTQSRPSAPSARADAWFCFETSSNQCTYMWRLDGCLLKSVARKGWKTTAQERVCGPPDVNSFAGYWKGSILFQLLRDQPKTKILFFLSHCVRLGKKQLPERSPGYRGDARHRWVIRWNFVLCDDDDDEYSVGLAFFRWQATVALLWFAWPKDSLVSWGGVFVFALY